MNKKSLLEIRNELEQKELHAKLAQVESHWGEDEQALAILADAVTELEKQAQAGAFGDGGLSPSQLLTMGVAMTNEFLETLDKQASEESADVSDEDGVDEDGDGLEDIDEDTLNKMAEAYEAALPLGAELGRLGLEQDALAKLAEAPADEVEEFAQFLVELSHALNAEDEA